MTKIYKIFKDFTADNYKDGHDPQLIYDYSSLGTSINIKYIPADYTNVLYFDGNLYRLDHELEEHQPIVLYKIPPDTGIAADDDWPGAKENQEEYKKCYYERRQLEIHHVNNSGKKLVLVITFRSSKGFEFDCSNVTPIDYIPDPNGLDLAKLMRNIRHQDKVYYKEDDTTTGEAPITIFYTEQYVEWDVDKPFWNGSFMDLPQLQKLDSLCRRASSQFTDYKGCGGNKKYKNNEYPSDLSFKSYNINYSQPYINYHYLSSEDEHKTLTSSDTADIYAIRNGTKYNESILKSTLRSDAVGLGVDTTGGGDESDDDGTDGVDDNEIFIDCSPINTTEEEIITKMDKDSLLKLNSGYTFNNIVKDITKAINNTSNEGFREGARAAPRSDEIKVNRNKRRRKRNLNVALNRQLKDLEKKYLGSNKSTGTYWHYKNNYVVPIAETILGIIIGIISCITFNIILNKVLKNK